MVRYGVELVLMLLLLWNLGFIPARCPNRVSAPQYSTQQEGNCGTKTTFTKEAMVDLIRKRYT